MRKRQSEAKPITGGEGDWVPPDGSTHPYGRVAAYFQPASASQALRSAAWVFSQSVIDCVSLSLILLFMQVQYFSTTSSAAPPLLSCDALIDPLDVVGGGRAGASRRERATGGDQNRKCQFHDAPLWCCRRRIERQPRRCMGGAAGNRQYYQMGRGERLLATRTSASRAAQGSCAATCLQHSLLREARDAADIAVGCRGSRQATLRSQRRGANRASMRRSFADCNILKLNESSRSRPAKLGVS